MPSPREQPPPGRKGRRQDSMPGGWLWAVILLGLAVALFITFANSSSPGRIPYSEFKKLADDKMFAKVVIKPPDYRMVGEFDKGKVEEAEQKYPDLRKQIKNSKIETLIPGGAQGVNDAVQTLQKSGTAYLQEDESSAWVGSLLMFLLPAVILILFFVFFLLPRLRDPLGGGFLSNYVKSPARRYDKSKMRVTFDDVADMAAAKFELQEIVDFLKSPEKFQRLGAQIPKGVLLIGPPGTGKTLLARAVAGEAGVPFYSISGSEFIQMFVGVGASRVRDMFRTAKENAPCLLFIDEIDAVGRMRGAGVGGGSDEREQTLNQILSEMDGFQPNESVIVIAATNRPDVLDSALLRPGRFDRHVTVDRPTWQGRLAILKVHTRNKPLADDVNLEAIARKMIGMTGADLRNLANEAALIATRENKNRIDRQDFEHAADRVLMGAKRDEVLSAEDKRRTAYHEAGHALVSWLEPAADRPLKVSIIPRGQSLGVNLGIAEEERFHYGTDYFKARLVTLMGGRAADRLIFAQPFAGHENDLKQATRLARFMVTHWGMSDRLGPMSFRVGEEHVFLGKEIQEQRDFSEESAAIIDAEVQKLLREADERAFQLLEGHRPQLELLVEALLQKEELHKEEIEQLLGVKPERDNGVLEAERVPSFASPAIQAAT
ncbi:MAG: ATP-dependent zinc metalloprotease FtsH [Planctomycetes bacterium]|nr:ATP-dependent zinc metalloprotease FtsH [Planctomycetota bacterium]